MTPFFLIEIWKHIGPEVILISLRKKQPLHIQTSSYITTLKEINRLYNKYRQQIGGQGNNIALYTTVFVDSTTQLI